MIWNAKLMPVLVEDDEMKLDFSVFDWICALTNDLTGTSDCNPDAISHLVRCWKDAKRISLSELRQHVDSSGELLHRKAIMSHRLSCYYNELLPITERRNNPCNLNHMIDLVANTCSTHDIDPFQLSELRSVLFEFESIILRSARNGHFDTVGRCFMTMALLLSDIATYLRNPEINAVPSEANLAEDKILTTLAGSFWNDSIETELISIKDGQIGPYRLNRNNILSCCCFLEKAAATMTGRCVRGNISSRDLEPVAGPISIGTTVIASAPARIDLSGGWSDTPPISYENGGAVANLAVTVDKRRPLQAKCRLVKGMDGILLRTESRTLSSDELISHTEVRIHQLNDMKDYNNPFGKCSLLKCALIYLGIVTIDEIDSYPSRSIQPYVENLCQREKLNMKAGLEVVSTSYLPTRCIGIELQNDDLVKAVLMLENMMTTGGTPIYFASISMLTLFILTVCCILLNRWVARPNWWIVWRAQTGNF
jgi:fucokinase